MPLKIVRNDMTKMHVDAIANTPQRRNGWIVDTLFGAVIFYI